MSSEQKRKGVKYNDKIILPNEVINISSLLMLN